MKQSGQWNHHEHRLYLEAMSRFKSWEQVSKHVKTRDPVQCRSHHQKMKCKTKRENMSFFRDQTSSDCSRKKDVGTQWESANLKYFSTLPVFLLDKIVGLDTGDSNFSTGSEDMSLGSISIFSSDTEGFEEFTCSQSSEEL
jgi:hypothetical protein